MSLLSYKGKIMQKALELFEQIEDFDENPYHQTRTIIFNREDMAFIKEAREELAALQQHKNCDECKYYTSTLCPVEEFSITSAELEKYPFYCNRYEPKGAMR